MTAGYLLKLQRAGQHLHDLEAKCIEWFGGENHSIVSEPDPSGEYERRLRVILKRPVPPDPIALLIGDVAYNLRSSLDHLAFMLNGGVGQQLGNESEFPIFGNENREGKPVDGAVAFKGTIAKKIRGMGEPAQTAIQRLQPYKRGDSYRDDPLWLLHTLCNIDKHRMLHPVALAHTGTWFTSSGVQKLESYGGLLQTETVVVRFTLDPGAGSDVDMKLKPMLAIGLADGPAIGIHARLAMIRDYIVNNVVPRLTRDL